MSNWFLFSLWMFATRSGGLAHSPYLILMIMMMMILVWWWWWLYDDDISMMMMMVMMMMMTRPTCDLKLLGCSAPVATFAEETFLSIKVKHQNQSINQSLTKIKSINQSIMRTRICSYFETWLRRAALACWWVRFTWYDGLHKWYIIPIPWLIGNICSVIVTIGLFTAVSVASTAAAGSFSSSFSPSFWSEND